MKSAVFWSHAGELAADNSAHAHLGRRWHIKLVRQIVELEVQPLRPFLLRVLLLLLFFLFLLIRRRELCLALRVTGLLPLSLFTVLALGRALSLRC